MSAAHPLPPQAAAAAARADHHHAILDELADIGMRIARRLDAAAATPPEPEIPLADHLEKTAAAFDRVARAIRRTVVLHGHLDDPVRQRAAARRQIIRKVEDEIHRHTEGDGDDDLCRELRERLDSPDLLDDVGNRPVEDIIREICRDLGLAGMPGTPGWKRRTPADIADLCARAAAPEPPAGSDLSPPATPEPRFRLLAIPPP